MVSAPCRNCENREVGCHGKCDRYIAFRKKFEEEKRAYKDSRYSRILNGELREKYYRRFLK